MTNTATTNDGGRRRLDILLVCAAGLSLVAFASYGFTWYDMLRAMATDRLWLFITDRDFANYWLAGQLTLSGEQQLLFTHDIYYARFREVFGADAEVRSWSYPPHFLLLTWPLGFTSYKVGLSLFMLLTLALFVYAAREFKRTYAAPEPWLLPIVALLGTVPMMMVTTQNGFLTGALLLLGLAWMRSKPVAAAVAFALLTIKPQLGLLIPVLLLFDRNWRVFGWTAGLTVALLGVSVAWFGIESWSTYLTQTLAYQREVLLSWTGPFMQMMPTVVGGLRTLEFSADVAVRWQWFASIMGAGLVLWILARDREPLHRAFAILAGTFLLTPYAFSYDMAALSVCAALLAVRIAAQTGPMVALTFAVIAAVPPVVYNLGRSGLPVTPLLLAGALVILISRQKPVRADFG